MKRGKRPFLVEVRRTGKKQPLGELDTGMSIDPDVLRRAEEALGNARAEFVQADAVRPVESARPMGRILPNLTEPPPVEPMAELDPPRRRGRPPGSKNKSKSPGLATSGTPGLPKRRGRPPKIRPEPVSRPMWQATPAPVYTPVVVRPLRTETATEAGAPPARRERRVSKILGRWVFGTMPTRSERWKRQYR